MPFRLLLSVVLMAMAAAVLLPALSAYQRTEFECRVRLTVAEISSAARAVYSSPGSSRTVALDLPPSFGISLERLSIGAGLDAGPGDMAIIQWKLSKGGEGRAAVHTTGGAVPMSGPDGQPLVLQKGRALLVLEARQAPAGSPVELYVRVEEA
jgi:type II secretory pathway pseudopilin PulG